MHSEIIRSAVQRLAFWPASRLTLALLLAGVFNVTFTLMMTIAAFMQSLSAIVFLAIAIASGFAINTLARAIELRMGEPREGDAA